MFLVNIIIFFVEHNLIKKKTVKQENVDKSPKFVLPIFEL